MLVIAIDRDSVHAGDDLCSHASTVRVDPNSTLRSLFDVLQTMNYLPSIRGGEATWIVCTPSKQIGVLAQQWAEPKMVVAMESLVMQVLEEHERSLLFRYWCQANPDDVFSSIQAGEELPSRYRVG